MNNYCPVPGPVPTSPANRNFEPGFMTKLMAKDLMLSQEAALQRGRVDADGRGGHPPHAAPHEPGRCGREGFLLDHQFHSRPSVAAARKGRHMIRIDYFLSLNSPWTYLGSARFIELVRRYGVDVAVKPANFGEVFAETGGLPLPKRSPAAPSLSHDGAEALARRTGHPDPARAEAFPLRRARRRARRDRRRPSPAPMRCRFRPRLAGCCGRTSRSSRSRP